MKKTLNLIEKFQLLADGESVPSSALRGDWIKQMLRDEILQKQSHGRHVSYRAVDADVFRQYIASKYEIRDLAVMKDLLAKDGTLVNRSEQVLLTGDSKFVSHRTMTGFLASSYVDIPAMIGGKSFIIHPVEGTSIVIHDYKTFIIPKDVIVIGIENSENFCQIARQKYLFKSYPRPLFVSRYPQNGDLVKWLERISNRYIHFGDFDLAGIHIFLSEFYSHLGPSRSEFFIPEDIGRRLPLGSRVRYDTQYTRYRNMTLTDSRLKFLVELIHREHRGYDQEGYIK